MPIAIKKTAGGSAHAPVFVTGPLATDSVKVDISALSSNEIDSDGYLKPGVPFSKNGLLVAAMTLSTPGSASYERDDSGTPSNGTVGSVSGRFGAPTEDIICTCIAEASNAGTFRVEGTVSGYIGEATVAVAFNSSVIGFTIADGSEDWNLGDVITIPVTGGVSDVVHGVTIAPAKVAAGNAGGDLSAAADCFVAVGTHGVVNRDIAEDVLGRSYTSDEVAGFAKSNLALTRT